MRELWQELAIYRARLRREHDQIVIAGWYPAYFARVERLAWPKEFLSEGVERRATFKRSGRVPSQSIADMKAALNLISAAVNGRPPAGGARG